MSLDLRGTQGAVVLPGGTVVQNYEKPPEDAPDASLMEMMRQVLTQTTETHGEMLRRDREREERAARDKNELMEAIADTRSGAPRLPPRRRTTVYSLAWLALFAPVPTFYMEFRHWLGVDTPAALSLALGAYAASALIFAYLWGFVSNQNGRH